MSKRLKRAINDARSLVRLRCGDPSERCARDVISGDGEGRSRARRVVSFSKRDSSRQKRGLSTFVLEPLASRG